MALPKNLFMTFIFYNLLLISYNLRHDIVKRNLVYPTPSLLQMILGVNVPTIFRNKTVSISGGYQMNFEVPTNLSYYQTNPYIVTAKRSVENNEILSREIVYQYLENMLEGFGLNGKECLLRTICELAETPFSNDDQNYVLEDILHFILTPSTDKKFNENNSYSDVYQYAEYVGKYERNCVESYVKCEVSILDLITNIF